MKNKMKVKRILKTIITITLTFLSIYFISICFARNGNNRKYHTFTKSKTDYDVLFFGTSHVLNAIAPMQLWNEYGITSYNLGYHGCGIVKTYYLLQIALKYHKPKIAVFDIFTIDITSKTPEAEPACELVPITLEEVRTVLAELSRDGKTREVKELLKKHGANKLSEVNPDEWEALLEEAAEIRHGS